MIATKTRFPKVKLEDLKKILPEMLDGNGNNNRTRRDKKKDKQGVAKTSKPKARS